MRHMMTGLVAAAAVAATMAASPALACGTADPCGRVYGGYDAYGYAVRERLPDSLGPLSHGPGPQYYYVNQGPLYSGPGNFAPVPTYQERAVTGWQTYDRPYYYGYNGGPYANATNHYYDGAPNIQGPVVTTYRFARRQYVRPTHFRPRRVAPKYYYAARPNIRYGHAARHGYGPRFYGPGQSMAQEPRGNRVPHYAGPRTRPASKPNT